MPTRRATPGHAYWLLKTEPEAYSYADLLGETKTLWDGIRSYAARNHLRAMRPQDEVLIYHSGRERAIVGTAKVVGEPGPDPADPSWSAVLIAAASPLQRPVPLADLRRDPTFAGWALFTQSRLSVVPVSPIHFRAVLRLGRR